MEIAMPRIYVACLASYNAGVLHGRWIDVSDVDTMQGEIDAMLRESRFPNVEVECPKCGADFTIRHALGEDTTKGRDGCPVCKGKGTVPSAEEYAIHDHEGFEGFEVSEHSNLADVAALGEAIDRADDAACLAELHSHLGNSDIADTVAYHEEHYAGTWRTLEDWAEEFLDDTGALKDCPDSLRPYIDFEKWARDAELGGDIFTFEGGSGIHVYWNR
jgi:antirestriction protein